MWPQRWPLSRPGGPAVAACLLHKPQRSALSGRGAATVAAFTTHFLLIITLTRHNPWVSRMILDLLDFLDFEDFLDFKTTVLLSRSSTIYNMTGHIRRPTLASDSIFPFQTRRFGAPFPPDRPQLGSRSSLAAQKRVCPY